MVRTLHTRGCSPRGYVRETRPVRGRITGTNKPLIVGRVEIPMGRWRDKDGNTTGMETRLVRIRTNSCKDRRKFARFCSTHLVNYELVDDTADGVTWAYQTTVRVWGTTAALEKLAWLDCVVSVERTLDAAPPRDRFALHDGNVAPPEKRKHAAPTVVKLGDGWVAVISGKGVSFGRA
jgi:hypothetical protein